jgi:hypothetical protein
MKIDGVFKTENVESKFKFKGHVYTLKEINNKLFLLNEYNQPIDYVMSLCDYANGDFIEIIDWNRVATDTLLFVKDRKDKIWSLRNFAFYENGYVYCWHDRMTSVDVENNRRYTKSWDEAQIYKK